MISNLVFKMVVLKEDYGYIQLTSDILSVITITSCFVLKVPQIVNILKVKNATGINIIGLLMELFSYTVMFSYNFRSGYALLTYLEYPIILLQEFVLILSVLYYKGVLGTPTFVGVFIYISMAFGFLSGIVSKDILMFLVPLCTPIGASSKVIQLIEILRSKNSECVSVLTWFISAFTNFTRVFTIFVDSADISLLLNFIINVTLSSAIMVAAYIYKPSRTKTAASIDKQKKFE